VGLCARRLLIALLLLGTACAPASSGAPPASAPAQAAPPSPPTPGQATTTTGALSYDAPAWQALVEAARKEGKLVMRGAPNPEARERIPRAFKERFDIDVEWDSARASDLYSRLEAERAAGLYSMDVVISGGDLATFVRNGWAEPLRPLLVAPEVLDPAAWRGSRLPFLDPKQQYLLQLEQAVYGAWVINPQVVGESELHALDDLLSPRWKGKISVDDPTVSGFGELSAVYVYLERGEDYFTRLYVDQAPGISRDDRQKEDWLTRGSYPISFGLAPKNVDQLIEQGLPVRDLGLLEGKGWVRGPVLALLKHAPHPHAAQLFANWIASPEGMRLHALVERLPPLRTDVEHPWVQPYQVPKEGVDYLNMDDYTLVLETKPPLLQRINEIVRK